MVDGKKVGVAGFIEGRLVGRTVGIADGSKHKQKVNQ